MDRRRHPRPKRQAAEVTLPAIYSIQEIPEFATEDEEVEFWMTHSISEELWNQLPRVDESELPTPRTTWSSTDWSEEYAMQPRRTCPHCGREYTDNPLVTRNEEGCTQCCPS